MATGSNWESYFRWKAESSHVMMIWCGIFIFPAFGLLDYYWLDHWQSFIYARLAGAAILLITLLIHHRWGLHPNVLAHISTQCVMQILMWMISRVETREQHLIYCLNASTAFIASALFLLWSYRQSIVLALLGLLGLALFQIAFSSLSFADIIAFGTLPLVTIIIMSQLFVYYRYRSIRNDYKTQEFMNLTNVELTTKNTQIARQKEEIELQRKHLEELNQLKDKLLIIVSHDFRAPLQSLKGVTQLLEKPGTLSAAEISLLANGIKAQLDTTYQFLENLLNWAKSQMHGLTPHLSPVRVRETILETLDLFKPIADEKKITFKILVPASQLVHADADMLRLIIRNLIANAVKFSYAGGNIIIASTTDGDRAVLSVQDFGMGLAEDEMEGAMSSGNLISRLGTGKEKGTGFGLLLCREFVQKNGGKFWFTSETEKGSTFYFSLPTAATTKLAPLVINQNTII